MKKLLFIFLLLLLLCAALPCGAQISKVDPILLTTPNPWVFECTDDLVLELLVQPTIDTNTGGRYAENYFLFLTVEFLYLQEIPWNGLDKSSFVLKHTDTAGKVVTHPLNYMMTSMMSLKNNWDTLSFQLVHPTLLKINLVFDIPSIEENGWSLLFRPAQRGSSPECEVEIPLKIWKVIGKDYIPMPAY